MSLVARSLKAYDEYDYPKPTGLFDRIRLMWKYSFERDPVRKKMLKDVILHERAARYKDRKTWHWNKMIFRHGTVISRKEVKVVRTRAAVLEYVQHVGRKVKQTVLDTPQTPTSTQRLEDARRQASLDNLRMLEAMVNRGEELKRQNSEREAEQSRKLVEQRTEKELWSLKLVLDNVVDTQQRTSNNLAGLVKRCKKNHKTRLRIVDGIMEKIGRSPP